MSMPMGMTFRPRMHLGQIPSFLLVMIKHLIQIPLASLTARAQTTGWIAIKLRIPLRGASFPARAAAPSSNTALDSLALRGGNSRLIIVRICVSGTSTGCEKRIWRRASQTPRIRGRGTGVCTRCFLSVFANGVLADFTDLLRAGIALGEEIDVATCFAGVGAAHHGYAEPGYDANVEILRVPPIEVAFENGAAFAADVDLAVEAGAEVRAALCGAGLAVECH